MAIGRDIPGKLIRHCGLILWTDGRPTATPPRAAAAPDQTMVIDRADATSS